jgi:hypothetical protein
VERREHQFVIYGGTALRLSWGRKQQMKIVVAHSDAVDGVDALAEVLAGCREQLAGAEPVGGLMFSSVGYPHEALARGVAEAFPGMPFIGCSTDGEFSSQEGFYNDSLVLTLFAGEGVEVTSGLGLRLGEDTEGAVRRAAAMATGDRGVAKLCITTPESMTADADTMVDALSAALEGTECPILGGTSGDHRAFGTTYQFCDGKVYSDSIPMLLFWGDFALSHGVASGWRPVGPVHTVTSASGKLVREIDGRPVMEVFRDYWGDASLGVLGQFPLAVLDDNDPDDFYLRAVFTTDAEEGSATFAAQVPQGAKVRITEVLRDGILEGSSQAMQQAIASFPEGRDPSSALVFSCAARKWLLGTRVSEEPGVLQAALPEPTVLSGFYCFGEIAPLQMGSRPRFHNETCVTLLLGQ